MGIYTIDDLFKNLISIDKMGANPKLDKITKHPEFTKEEKPTSKTVYFRLAGFAAEDVTVKIKNDRYLIVKATTKDKDSLAYKLYHQMVVETEHDFSEYFYGDESSGITLSNIEFENGALAVTVDIKPRATTKEYTVADFGTKQKVFLTEGN